jgi:pyruvate, water dikinase
MSSSKYIAWFKNLTIKDIPTVGGKTASLGEMYAKLGKKGIDVPNGFAITAEAYRDFLKENTLDKKIKDALKGLNVKKVKELSAAGERIRNLILRAEIPWGMAKQIRAAYAELAKEARNKSLAVAVRSSATAEDLPNASFAGQQETYLNVRGEKELLVAFKHCLASLFTDRAISYREDKGFDHLSVALSVAVQKMVRSDVGASGVMFTLDTESGFKGVVLINAAYGLGEYVVKGRVVPDQFFIFKNGIKNGFKSIISRRLGSKQVKLVYSRNHGTKQLPVKISDQNRFCVSDKDVVTLAKWGVVIEEHYGHPMDIEWAKDGETGKMYIVQARSETVKSQAAINEIETYRLEKKGAVLLEGVSVGQKIGAGRVRVIDNPSNMKNFKKGEVLVTRITDPDWEPIMRLASAIVTEQGGKTSHAAIVSRELGTPCVVGATGARKILKNGEAVTVSCAEGETGFVYKGLLPFAVTRTALKELKKTRTKIMMNVGDPNGAFTLAAIPNDGVGLAREEFIFTDFIKIHPLALVNYDRLKDKKVKAKIDQLTLGYTDKKQYCIDKLAEGISFIASAFHPSDVIVRLSDFKTNEYATLIGGAEFEPKEENPMIGWRGASRYYDPKYVAGFRLECEAIKKVRDEWGLKNVIVMIPFCRTPEEGRKVIAKMKEFGLERGKNGLQVYVMCEIPSNVILAKEYSKIFDGFSIGSNDLTQLTLGVDRDSALVSHIYDENNLAVKTLIRDVIKTAHRYKRKVGICGQAPSDYPKFAEFLVEEGIDSISLNPDTVLKTRQHILAIEKKIYHPVYRGAAVISKTIIIMAVGLMLAVLGLAI